MPTRLVTRIESIERIRLDGVWCDIFKSKLAQQKTWRATGILVLHTMHTIC